MGSKSLIITRRLTVIAILALLPIAGHVIAADWVPGPRFTAFPEQEVVEGWEWPRDALVHLAIDDPATELSPDYEQDGMVIPAPWDSSIDWLWIDFSGLYDLKPGDLVTLTHGTTTRTHIVQSLAVSAVDGTADRVAGSADTGALVYVWPYENGDLQVAALTINHSWLADFSDLFDLVAGACGRSEILDEASNATAVDWCVPNTRLTAFPESDAVEGWEWPLGAVVHLTIDDPGTVASPDFEQDGTMTLLPWDDRPFVHIDFAGEYDLKLGDIVSLSDAVTARTHTVRNLAVSNVDASADTVSGTADAGSTVYAHIHGVGGSDVQMVAFDGTWFADFAALGFDLAVGIEGRSEVRDEAGNSTAVDWQVHNPFIWADPVCDCINGWNWQYGKTIALNVYTPDGALVHSAEQVDPGGVFFELWPFGIDLQAGYRITLSDTQITKELVLSPLQITSMDREGRTITGIYDPNAGFWINIEGQQPDSLAFEGNQWVATFAELRSGAFGEVAQPDGDGDMTGFGFNVPEPTQDYAIFTYDTLTGETRQITSLPDNGEYNPAWSPDGKKIAHDVVNDAGIHSIYITDIDAGVSTPLAGTEDGGNDAVWSPNGQWIAFDRYWYPDASVYIVPTDGGQRIPIAHDAISASWSPNSKYMVFARPSDGSIWTIDLASGMETLVAMSGANPEWSPNGQWIAYERGSDIWVVNVNHKGVPLAAPIQLTSGSLIDSQPTWSGNSDAIVFHSGLDGDYDLWTVPVTGSPAVWLTGLAGTADYDPRYSNNGRYIAYAGAVSAALSSDDEP